MAEIRLTSWYDMKNISFLTRFYASQMVQDFWTINSTNLSRTVASLEIVDFSKVWQLGNAVTSGSFFIYRGSTLRIFTVFVSTLLQIWANLHNLDFTRNWNIRNKEIPYNWGPCYMKFLLRWPHLASWGFGIHPWWHQLTPIGPGWQKLSSNQHCLRRRHHSMLCLTSWQT